MSAMRPTALSVLLAVLVIGIAPERAAALGLNCADPFVCYTLTIKLDGDGSGTILSGDGHIECFAVPDPSAPGTCSYQYRTLLTTPAIGVVLNSIMDLGSRACFVSKSDTAAYAAAPIPAAGDCTYFQTDPGAVPELPPLELVLSGNATIEYQFDAGDWAVIVSKAGAGKGTVTSSPAGINCGTACRTSLTFKTRLSLTASASPGSVFSGWSGSCAGQKATCSVTILDDIVTTASFTLATVSPTPAVRPTARPTVVPPVVTAGASPGAVATPSGSPASTAGPTPSASSAESGAPSSSGPPGGVVPSTATAPDDLAPIGIGIAVAGLLIALSILGLGLASRRSPVRREDGRP